MSQDHHKIYAAMSPKDQADVQKKIAMFADAMAQQLANEKPEQQQKVMLHDAFPRNEDGKPERAKGGDDFPGVEQVPYTLVKRVGAIFAEGEPIYGRDNWKKGVFDYTYQRKRLRHAIQHLMMYANGDRSEDHLAKVAWFCGTQMFHEEEEAKLSEKSQAPSFD